MCDKTLYVHAHVVLDAGEDVTVDNCVVYKDGALDVVSGSLHVRNKLFTHGYLYSSSGCNITAGEHVCGQSGGYVGEGDHGKQDGGLRTEDR